MDYDQQPASVGFSREIKRPTMMEYSVIITNLETRALACDAPSAPFLYSPKRNLPPSIDLGWWAPSDPRCAHLPPGEYVAETCWTATILPILPRKTVCLVSNPFTVRHPESGE